MEITFIGTVIIVLSIIAFLKDEDMLLGVTIFFSTFTAAISLNITVTTTIIISYIIPMLLWMVKQVLNIIKNRKSLTIANIKTILKENKLFTALLFFTISIVISNIWLFISKISYSFYDSTYLKDEIITFSLLSVKKTIGFLPYLIFAMMVSLTVKDKEKIRKLLKIFGISTICGVCWGFIQYALYYLNIDYPAFLFNNNPGYAQWYHQVFHGIKRINSIATEPSTFSINLLAAISIILIPYIYGRNRDKKFFELLTIVAVIACTILTTSTTALVGLVITLGTLLIYLVVKYIKENKSLEYKKKILNLIGCSLLGITVASILALGGIKLSQPSVSKPIDKVEGNIIENITQNEQPTTDIIIENVIQPQQPTDSNTENSVLNSTFIDAIKEMTISKLSSESGRQRLEREIKGFEIFMLSPIFGVSYGSFRTFTLFTNVLVNLGILGLISLLYLLYIVLKQIILNRKKDEEYFLIFLLSIIGMIVAFFISIPDLIYIYFWIIIVLAYNYFSVSGSKTEISKEKFKIGIDGRSLTQNRTGIGTYTYEVIKKLNSVDTKNTYYIYYNKEIYIDFKLNKNFKLCKINSKRGFLGIYFKLPKLLRNDEVDIFWGPQHIMPMRNKFTKNIKFVLTVHDLAIHKFKTVGEWKNKLIQSLFLKTSCKNSDIIIADSEATKQDIIEIFKIKEEKIKVVYLGTNFDKEYKVDKNEENEILNKFNIVDKNYLFFISTIEPRKNIITLIKAFEILKDKYYNKTLKLILAGGLGWKYEEIINTINNSEFKSDINLAGYISKQEKECLFHNAKCFVYPSLYEGFGLPILEAMQKGAIVVTSNISSIPEVGEKVPFYLNDLQNEEELAILIKRVLDLKENDKKKIIEEGYKQVEKFTWDKCANEILYLLEGGNIC